MYVRDRLGTVNAMRLLCDLREGEPVPREMSAHPLDHVPRARYAPTRRMFARNQCHRDIHFLFSIQSLCSGPAQIKRDRTTAGRTEADALRPREVTDFPCWEPTLQSENVHNLDAYVVSVDGQRPYGAKPPCSRHFSREPESQQCEKH